MYTEYSAPVVCDATNISCPLLIGTVSPSEARPQILDQLPVERERGITVKAQTATMYYQFKQQRYMMNLIDTPVRIGYLTV